jgi:signal transduction histidine kinase/CheY-like chemotaxis protein
MNTVVGLSFFSALVFLLAAVYFFTSTRRLKIKLSVSLPLTLSLGLYGFISISNFLEHSGITAFLDPLEDIAEVVFTLVFLFFVNNWRKEQSELQFKELFRLAPMSLMEVDAQGKVVKTNDVFTRNLKYNLNSQTVSDIEEFWRLCQKHGDISTYQHLDWKKRITEALNSGKGIAPEEVVCISSDKKKKTLLLSASKIRDNLLISMVDISGQKEAEVEQEKLQKQLLQAQKLEAVGTLAGGVAHDFNNILGAILGFTELTLEKMDEANPFRKNLENIYAASKKSSNLVRQLLIFARRQNSSPEYLDINQAIAQMMTMLKRLLGEEVDLKWSPCLDACIVKMDPTHLDQVITNLCINARDALAGVGKISLKTQLMEFDELSCNSFSQCRPGKYVRISVVDNGCGMDKETLEHLFEPFFTTKGAGKGTGLGLSTVYGIVNQSKGFINVYSEKDLGATFNIYLPFEEKEISILEQEKQKVPYARGETVLLVEDEPVLLEMVHEMLERLEYNVIDASEPEKALELIRSGQFQVDVILSDVVMPSMNGRTLIDKCLEFQPDLHYIFMSGYTADVIVDRGVSEERDYFLQKPFSLRDLAFKLRNVLGEK